MLSRNSAVKPSPGPSALGSWVGAEELEYSELCVGRPWDDGWAGGGRGDEFDAGQGGEDEPAGGLHRSVLGVDAGHLLGGCDPSSDFAFDEAEDEQGEADDGD